MIKQCRVCKKDFRIPPRRQKTANFCSKKCFYIEWAEKMNGNTRGFVKGFKHSEETKKKMKGRIVWNKGKHCLYEIGEKHHNWRGGITPKNILLRKCLETKLWREAVFTRDKFTCQKCKIKGSQTGGHLNAHHIKSFAKYPELRFELSNGITLCKECHRKTENFGGRAKRK